MTLEIKETDTDTDDLEFDHETLSRRSIERELKEKHDNTLRDIGKTIEVKADDENDDNKPLTISISNNTTKIITTPISKPINPLTLEEESSDMKTNIEDFDDDVIGIEIKNSTISTKKQSVENSPVPETFCPLTWSDEPKQLSLKNSSGVF
eukprot:UN33239